MLTENYRKFHYSSFNLNSRKPSIFLALMSEYKVIVIGTNQTCALAERLAVSGTEK